MTVKELREIVDNQHLDLTSLSDYLASILLKPDNKYNLINYVLQVVKNRKTDKSDYYAIVQAAYEMIAPLFNGTRIAKNSMLLRQVFRQHGIERVFIQLFYLILIVVYFM